MDGTTEPLNRRQRVDAAEAALTRAHQTLGDSEARQMRLEADVEIARARTIEATKAVDMARGAFFEALAYQDPPPAILPGSVTQPADAEAP